MRLKLFNNSFFRHWCEQSDNLEKYGWLQHDGSNFGVQEIEDGPFKLTTSFVKKLGGENGGEWTARISVEVLVNFHLFYMIFLKFYSIILFQSKYKELVLKDEQVSLIWYTAMDSETLGFIAPTNSNTDITGIRGETSTLGEFKMTLFPQQGKIEHESFLSTLAPGLDLLKETVISSLRLAQDNPKVPSKIVLGGQIYPLGAENVGSRHLEIFFLICIFIVEGPQFGGYSDNSKTTVYC